MAAIFGDSKIFGKLPKIHFLDTLWIENFNEIALSRTVKIEANLCFSIFGKSSKIQMAAIFGDSKIFGILPKIHFLDTRWIENFDEIALSRTVKKIEPNLCFSILGKNLKIQNGRHFWEEENFLKIANSTLVRYPVSRKFRRNRSISHG